MIVKAPVLACLTCQRFFKPESAVLGGPGECRAFPPRPVAFPQATALGQMQVVIKSLFPLVDPTDWCGCYEGYGDEQPAPRTMKNLLP